MTNGNELNYYPMYRAGMNFKRGWGNTTFYWFKGKKL